MHSLRAFIGSCGQRAGGRLGPPPTRPVRGQPLSGASGDSVVRLFGGLGTASYVLAGIAHRNPRASATSSIRAPLP